MFTQRRNGKEKCILCVYVFAEREEKVDSVCVQKERIGIW